MNDFAVFILSWKRPDRVYTLEALRKHGYTGPVYIVVSEDDPTLDEYHERFGKRLLTFKREEVQSLTDTMDPLRDLSGVVYARNATPSLAEALGLRVWLDLDDDYKSWYWKYGPKRDGGVVRWLKNAAPVQNLDAVMEAYVEFMEEVPRCLTIAMVQSGDIIGGPRGSKSKAITLWRKAMNSFFRHVERPFYFRGRLNEDVNAYLYYGNRGGLMFTYLEPMLYQMPTQQNPGGLTELYLDMGTYTKSFFSLMVLPTAVKITPMGNAYPRLHHRIDWDLAVPKIISEKWRRWR